MINYDVDYAKSKRKVYNESKPFPHIVIDNFFNTNSLKEALSNFPKPSQVKWIEYDNPLEKKMINCDKDVYHDSIRKIINFLNSKEFLNFLETLTGNNNLIADADLVGGGLHQSTRGGKLDIHADFNVHYKTKNVRCINLILFLNDNWKEEYGGHLELWDQDMSECEQKILPIFNRVVIFNTNETSYHGHPEPLTCPPDRDWETKLS